MTVRDNLRVVIAEFGVDVSRDAQRCRGLLNDYCRGEFRRDVNIAVMAVEEEIPADLLKAAAAIPIAAAISAGQRKLRDNRGMAVEAALWAVETWAFALHLRESRDCKTPASLPASLTRPSSDKVVQAPDPSPPPTAVPSPPPAPKVTPAPKLPKQYSPPPPIPPRQPPTKPRSSLRPLIIFLILLLVGLTIVFTITITSSSGQSSTGVDTGATVTATDTSSSTVSETGTGDTPATAAGDPAAGSDASASEGSPADGAETAESSETTASETDTTMTDTAAETDTTATDSTTSSIGGITTDTIGGTRGR